jgi:hypothetical protein
MEPTMTPYWFAKKMPSSRHGIENAVRLAFWAAGFGDTWFTCTQAEPPYKCQGLWALTEPFECEWMPKDYFLLKMKQPNQRMLEAFERVLGHRALAAYRDGNNDVVVEWRARESSARFAELEAAHAQELERLS